MIGDLFDSPWKILIIAAVVLILFGSRKMPEAARSLGRSMRILKTEIKDLHEDDAADGAQAGQPQQAPVPPQQLAAPAVAVPVVPVTTAADVPVSTPVAPAAPVAAPAPSVPYTPAGGFPAAAAPPPASVPVSAEVQQDTRPA